MIFMGSAPYMGGGGDSPIAVVSRQITVGD
jgi:hypothetical protein